jgi:hypothetical protein
MNVFTEWHHGGLFHSQQMLWEGRLGGKLFAPVGTQWVTEGYWKLSELPETIKQYLDPLSCRKDPDGYLYYPDESENIEQRRITFEQFKETKFDIILCTLQEHEIIYRDLQKKYQPQAKFIRLSGNTGERTDFSIFDNFIDTTGIYNPPPHINTVQMCQEFPLESFYFEEPKNHKTIKNFMNEMHTAKSLPIWEGLRALLPDYTFKMHGSNGDDGMIAGLPALGDSMRDMAFLFHVKHHGEGFGHVIHNSYSGGRPAIAMMEFYRGKLAEHFLIDDFSAILLDNKNYEQAVEKIRFWSIPENHLRMCKNARGLFEKYVNFDEDEKRFRKFLENLK